jgi:outer membrane protein assembly factor BamA
MALRLPTPLFGLLLVAPCLGQAIPSIPAVKVQVLNSIAFIGGSEDDRSFATAAMGLKAGDAIGEEGFHAALMAVRATDRFSKVDGHLEEGPSGVLAVVEMVPWPAIKAREWRGEFPRALRNGMFTGMHKGGRAGDLRIARWQVEGEQHLRDAGYSKAHVRISREEGGTRLIINIDAGAPDLVKSLTIEGGDSPYSSDRLQSITGIRPGKSIWTEDLQRIAAGNLRNRLVKDERFEGTAEFLWDSPTGNLRLILHAGPVVHVRHEGDWSIWWKSFNDLIPLARASSYSPELLDEGDRRIIRYLRDKGYLDAQVAHRREVLKGTADQPREVAVTFAVQARDQTRVSGLRFEQNRDFDEQALSKVAALPSSVWSLGRPPATPDLMNSVENQIKNFYWNQGYSNMTIRRMPIEHNDGKANLVYQVREGNRQYLDKIVLEMPSDPSWLPWVLAESLTMVFSSKPLVESAADASTLVYRSDRGAMRGVTARIRQSQDPSRPEIRTFTLTTSQPLLFIKNDLASVFTSLRQRLTALGVQRPMPRLNLEAGEGGYLVRIIIPDQPRYKVNRLVVQGSDVTKARAVFRETRLEPGVPLDPDKLSKAQANLGNLDAFQQTDMVDLSDTPNYGSDLPWRNGDLLLRTDERPPWVLSTSFGYDKSQGYHFGVGAQRLNFMGMGRTLDMGIRAGDTTIQNPTLRKLFPTGDFNRSVDSYSVGYTDPWFLPGSLKNVLSDRTQYHVEAAYIEETQAAFLAHRRRLTNSLEWKIGDNETVSLGHRYERTDIKPNMDGISLDELFIMAGVPGSQTIISAPYFQVVVDNRDKPFDPKRGTYFLGRLELANQLFGTGPKYSFAKLDVRKQWNWSIGEDASGGVVTAGARIGIAKPTSSSVDDLPLTERFFAGGPFTVRGVEPDFLGPVGTLGIYETVNGVTVRKGTRMVPLGGQGLVVFNLEYRFPIFRSPTLWGEIFADSGQVYAKLKPGARLPGDAAPFPPLRTTIGAGLILRLGLPIKFEYAVDLKRILNKPRTQQEIDTQLRGILVSAGYQF